jgi:hypothetical protein
VPRPADAWAEFRAAFVTELRQASRTSQFWIAVARQSIPVIGVAFFAWPALQIGIYFVLQSWLMLSLYCATDMTFDPEYRKGKLPRDMAEAVGALLKNFFGAIVAVGILLGLFGGFMLFIFFEGDSWDAFFRSGWHERSFLYGLLGLGASCLVETVRFARSLPQRTPAQIEADDLRIASTFYRVILMFVACLFVGAAPFAGLGDLIFVLATSLIVLYFEALPRSAAAFVASMKKTPRKAQ